MAYVLFGIGAEELKKVCQKRRVKST